MLKRLLNCRIGWRHKIHALLHYISCLWLCKHLLLSVSILSVYFDVERPVNFTRTLVSSICYSLSVNQHLSIHIGIQVIDNLPLNSYQFCMQISVTFHEFCVQLYQHVHINFILKQDCFSGERESFIWYVLLIKLMENLALKLSCAVQTSPFTAVLVSQRHSIFIYQLIMIYIYNFLMF